MSYENSFWHATIQDFVSFTPIRAQETWKVHTAWFPRCNVQSSKIHAAGLSALKFTVQWRWKWHYLKARTLYCTAFNSASVCPQKTGKLNGKPDQAWHMDRQLNECTYFFGFAVGLSPSSMSYFWRTLKAPPLANFQSQGEVGPGQFKTLLECIITDFYEIWHVELYKKPLERKLKWSRLVNLG